MATIVPAQQQSIAKLYTALFNRAPDAAGFGFWVQALSNGVSLPSITTGFLLSPESKAIYPSSQTSEQFITTFYTTVFGRAPDEAGRSFWAGVLNANGGSSSDAAKSIVVAKIIELVSTPLTTKPADITDAQYAQTVADRTTFANKIDVGIYYAVEVKGTSADVAKQVLAGVTDTVASVDAAKAIADSGANGGTSFTLAAAVDSLTGTAGNDTFNGYIGATGSTLTAADVINGGSGTDKLNLVAETGGTFAGQINAVEVFNIRQVSGTGAYNFATVEGEKEVWSNVSATAIGVTGLGTGTVVGIRGNNVNSNGAVSFAYATATDAVSIAIADGVKGTPNISATAGTATTATIASTGLANTVGTILLTGGTNTLTSLNVTATKDLTAVLDAADFAATATLTITGAGKVNLGSGFSGATINAAANTGGLTIGTTAAVTKAVTGSTAADAVTVIGALVAGGTINLGAGNDKLLAGAAAAIASTNVIDGGDGVDSVSASLINAANAGVFKNFEALDLSSNATLDVALVTASTIASLTLSGGAGVAALTNVNTGVGLQISGANTGSTTIGVKNAATTTTDTFAISFVGEAASGATAAAPTAVSSTLVVLNEVENVTIASTGTGFVSNTIGLTDNKLKTLTITGDKDLALTFTGTNGTNPAAAGGAVSSIDGSAATGKLNINTTNVTADNAPAVGLTIKTGSANDIVTLGQKATVTLGAGNDTVIVSSAGATVSGGLGTDKFNFQAAVTGVTTITEATGVIKNVITDFATTDNIVLLAANTTFTNTKVVLGSSVTTLDSALAAATLAGDNNLVKWFQYGSDTFVVANDAVTGVSTGDVIVKLTGLIDLTSATFDAATDTFTL